MARVVEQRGKRRREIPALGRTFYETRHGSAAVQARGYDTCAVALHRSMKEHFKRGPHRSDIGLGRAVGGDVRDTKEQDGGLPLLGCDGCFDFLRSLDDTGVCTRCDCIVAGCGRQCSKSKPDRRAPKAK